MAEPQDLPTTKIPQTPVSPLPNSESSAVAPTNVNIPETVMDAHADVHASPPRFGRFLLRRFHAKGGLGEVHVAEDEELGRTVALKRIQDRHLHNPDFHRRLLQEAAITAKLEHPGVVPIYGLVQGPGGQPSYAMRFIEGESFQEAIDRFHQSRQPFDSLPFRHLLGQFVNICNTIAYAHSRGIIHRDIKPSNVMIGKYGETLVVDWGLAKLLEPTRLEHPGGETMPMMKPSVDSDEGTQLGQAVGTLAYMSPEQAAGRLDKVGPCSDIFSLGATLYEMLAGDAPIRGHDQFESLELAKQCAFPAPRSEHANVPRPLEAICLKAMAAVPRARYATAKELADDVERWLADEPVEGHREAWPVRAARWMRRHRSLVTGLTAALLVGLISVTVALVALEAAYRGEEAAKNVALSAQARAEIQRRDAETARQQTHKAFDDLTNEKALAYLKTQPELRPEQRAFLERAAKYYLQVATEVGGDEPSRWRVAESNARLGFLLEGLGRQFEAEGPYRRAIDLLERLAADIPATPDYRRELATSHNNLGNLLTALGQMAAAEKAYRRALDLQERLVADLANAPDSRQQLARSHNNLGLLLAGLGRRQAAEEAFRRALDLQEKLVADFAAEPRYCRELAISYNNLANLLVALGQPRSAEESFRRALDIQEKLAAEFGTGAEYRQELARGHSNLGAFRASLGQFAAAEQAFRRALELQEQLAADFPTLPGFRQELARSQANLANLLAALGQRQAAEQAYRRALDFEEKLVADFSKVPEYRQDLASNYLNYGALLVDLQQGPAAEQVYRRALDIQEKLVAEFPAMPEYRQELARGLSNLGALLTTLGQQQAAEQAYRQALSIREKLANDFPGFQQYGRQLAGTYGNFGKLLCSHGKAEASLEWYAKAIALLEPLVRQEPRLITERLVLRNSHWGRAEALDRLARHADALEDWDRALALNLGVADLAAICSGRAQSLARAGNHVEAAAEANTLAESAGLNGGALYDLACVFTLAAAAVKDDAKLRDQYAARAVELLRQAVAKGFKDATHMKKDIDLDPLREREDFKKLLADLEKNQ
jgi:eukaryotic-like serine/threonine-protein kinase